MRMKFSVAALTAVAALVVQAVVPAAVSAQTWPQRSVRFVLPFGPASGADIAARLLSERLQTTWGQPVVVEGKPGGDGLLSVGSMVNAKDDHVLFFGPSSTFVVHPYVHENLPYDPETDLQPIAGVATVQIAVGVPGNSGMTTLKDFVERAKAEPGKLSFAVAPGFSELVFNGFVREQALQVSKVPYRDITTSPTDLGEGRIQLSMMSFAALRPHAQSGRVRVVAINDNKRSEIAPEIPSVVEAGYPNLVASPVLGLIGPRHMSIELRKRLAGDVIKVLQDSVVRERLLASGQPASPLGVDEYAAALKGQRDQVARIAKLLGMARKK
jgi:tripartite-type tricarboxylate transporter receptor subunit TctC